MELPYVYIDSLEQNADIANASSFIAQARRIIASDAVSEGVKQEIFATAMDCIADIKRYYQAKQKEEQLLKMDAEIDGKLFQVQQELANKERLNVELQASIEKQKLKIRVSEMELRRSRERTSELLRQRKELEDECKRLNTQAEQTNAMWATRLQTARDQQTRLQEIMSRSPRLARQNHEKNAVMALTKRLDELKMECCQFEEEKARAKRELEFQTATPLRIFMVNFAKIALRTYEMQEKLIEARRTNEQLKKDETERRAKVGASDYDVFDVTFASQDIGLNKTAEYTAVPEPPKSSLHVIPEAAEEETVSGGTLNSSGSLHSTPPAQPPPASEQDVILARTNAVKNYVTQQSEAVARKSAESDDNDSGEMTRDEDERESVCNRESQQHQGEDIEVTSNADEECAPTAADNDMNETVEEHDVVMQNQEAGPGDFSDDDSAMDSGAADVDQNVTMEEGEEEVMEEAATDKGRVHSTPTTEGFSQFKNPGGSQKSVSFSQQSQKNSVDPCSSSMLSTSTLNLQNPSPSVDASQEANAFLETLLKAPRSPIQEEMPFNFNCNSDNDDFDPTAALNISTHSNDPGADFLSLMESANEKREKQRKSSNSPAGDFSFSMFGLGNDAGADGGSGGDFAFDFGSTSHGGEGDDDGFHFNFGENSDNSGSNEKSGGGFNLFNF